MEKILDYEFIQTKDATYLAFIQDYIRHHVSEQRGADEIFRTFSGMIDARRG